MPPELTLDDLEVVEVEESPSELTLDDLEVVTDEPEGDVEPEPIDDGDYRDLGPIDAAMAGAVKPIKDLGTLVSDPGGSITRFAEGVQQIPGAVVDAFEEDPYAAGKATAEGVGSMASTVAGAGIGATMGSAVPVIGTAIGGVVGAAGGYLGFEALKDGLNQLLGSERKSVSQSIGETGEVLTGGAMLAPLASIGRTVKQGRGFLQRRSEDRMVLSASERSVEESTKAMLGRSSSKHVNASELDKASSLISKDLISTMSAGEPVNVKNILRRTRDTLGVKDSNGRWAEGSLLKKYGDEVEAYLSQSKSTYGRNKAENLFEQALDDTVFQTNAKANVESIRKEVENSIETAFARKAGFSNRQIMAMPAKRTQVERLKKTLNKNARGVKGYQMSPQVRQQQLSRLQRLEQTIDDYETDLDNVRLSASEYWKFTNDSLRSKSLNFSELESSQANSILANYRKKVQDDLTTGIRRENRDLYRAASQRYAAGRDIQDWADDGIVALESRQKEVGTVGLNAYKDISKSLLSWERQMPSIIKLYRNAEDALHGNYQGKASRFSRLSNMLVNIVPQKIGGTLEEVFSPRTIGALRAAEVVTSEFLATNPPTPEDTQLGNTVTEDFANSISKGIQYLQQGLEADETTKAAIASQMLKDPATSKLLSVDSQTGLMEGVDSIGGRPLSRASLERYFRNLENSDLNNFEKTERRSYFYKNHRFMEEPAPVTEPEVDVEEVEKEIQRGFALEKMEAIRSSRDVVKMSSTKELIKQAEERNDGSLRLVSFNDNLEQDGFDEAFNTVLGNEGGFVDDPRDRGGRTNMGVTQKTYNSYLRRNGQKKRDVEDITEEEAREIYREFWEDVSGADLPYPLDVIVFDAAINSGPARAVKHLQSVLGVKRDGKMGPETLDAVDGSNIQRVARDFLDVRDEFYERLDQPEFIRGWKNRTKKMRRLIDGSGGTRVA